MYNDLFHIGSYTVHTYGLMIAIGTIFAFCVGMFRAKRKGLDYEFVFDVGFYSMIAGLIGTRLLFYIVELPNIIKNPSMLWDFNYGYVVFGGIIGGVAMGLFYCKRKKKNFFDYFDVIMPSIILAQAFGRLGCFFAGCCYGKETKLPIGIVFHHSEMAPNGVKLLPTQLISSAGDFLIYFILILYAKKLRKRGRVGAMYFILYSIGRFFVEFLRDDYRGSIGFLSTSQIISIGILAIGIFLFVTAKERPIPKDMVSSHTPDNEETDDSQEDEYGAEEEQDEASDKEESSSEIVDDDDYEVVYLHHEDSGEK